MADEKQIDAAAKTLFEYGIKQEWFAVQLPRSYEALAAMNPTTYRQFQEVARHMLEAADVAGGKKPKTRTLAKGFVPGVIVDRKS